MPDALKPIAKAIVAFLVPITVALAAKLLDQAGVDVPVDPGVVETLVTSAVTAIAVWATRNRQPV